MKVVVENWDEIKKRIIGEQLNEFFILSDDDDSFEEPHCTKNSEVLMLFTNGKEMRIYIDEDGNLCVYTD